MNTEILKEISNNTKPKQSIQITVSENKTRFKTRFNPAIQLDKNKKYEIALVNLNTYYSFPNIHTSKNLFIYTPDSVNWFDILIPEGSYDITDINSYIQSSMKQNDHYNTDDNSYYIRLSANPNTLKSVLTLENNYKVDFTPTNSLNSVLGFNNEIYTAPYTESEQIVNILSINSVLINIDIISGSYVNGTRRPTIYSFFPNVSPGYKIVENPTNLVYLPITVDTIHSLETVLTDQNGKLLNLRGENLTIRFHLKEI